MGRMWGNNGHGMAPESSPSLRCSDAAATAESNRSQEDGLTSNSTQICTAEGNADPEMPHDVEAQLPHQQQEKEAQSSGKEGSKDLQRKTKICAKENPHQDNIIKAKEGKPRQQSDGDSPVQDPNDIIISSIQALPPPSPPSNTFSGQVGAHHVSAAGGTAAPPSQVVIDTSHHRNPENADDDDGQTVTSMTIGLESLESGFGSALTSHTLVEAHLVTTATTAKDDDDGEDEEIANNPTSPAEVYQAEKISSMAAALSSSRRTKYLLAAAVLVLCALVGTVVALALNQENDKDSLSPTTTRTPSPEPSDSVGQEGFKCLGLGSHSVLYNAITAYFEDPTPNSSIAKQLGYPIGSWCVSGLRNFDDIFTPYRNETTFNVNLSEEALHFARYLQQDIGQWNLSNTRTLVGTFRGIQNLSVAALGIDRWDVSNARNLNELFRDTQWQQPVAANNMSDLSSWNTSSVTTIAKLFQSSTVENGTGIGSWDTSQVESISYLAEGAKHFNEDIGRWNTQSVLSMQGAFKYASNFNQDISQWNTSSVQKLNMAFSDASKFNQPIGDWDTSNVFTLQATFKSTPFNQDLSTWEVSKVTKMIGTFRNSSFNQDISGWNVSSAKDLRWMFESASNFSQNLCSWGSLLPPTAKVDGMFKHTSCPNTSDPLGPEGPFCFNCHS